MWKDLMSWFKEFFEALRTIHAANHGCDFDDNKRTLNSPQFNINGLPMINGFDSSGNVYGVTNNNAPFGGI